MDTSNPSDPHAPRFDWRARYEEDVTPWDLGGAHPGLVTWLAGPGADLARERVIVPGSGKGHDPVYFAEAGSAVDAVDIVDLCAAHCAERLAAHGGSFHVANFLGFDAARVAALGGPWDLLYEHTIFCAIDPEQRVAFGAAAAACVRPGGHLLSFLFPGDKPLEEGGPPFRATPADLAAALGAAFELVDDAEVLEIPAGRRWLERRLLFRRLESQR